ncbi:nuclease A inhibitor family protein [Rhodoflexus sp.]
MLPIDNQAPESATIRELRRLSNGLLLLSESEAPFEIAALTAFPECPEGMEEVSLADVLGYAATVQEWHSAEDKAIVARFAAFQDGILRHLDGLRVYKSIEGGRKQVWIIGNSPEGIVAISTSVVET